MDQAFADVNGVRLHQDRALLPGNLDGLERFVPDLTVRRVPDGSHWVVHEQPALVNRLVREFLAKATPR